MDASPSHGPVSFESLLREQCTVITSFTAVRRQAILDAGLFDPAFRRSEDFDLWLRMAHQGVKMTFQRAVLGKHTLRGEGLSAHRDALREAQIAVYQKVLATLDLSAERSALVRAQIERCEALVQLDKGKDYLISCRYREAAAAIKQANVFYRRISLRLTLALLRIVPSLARGIYLICLKAKLALRKTRNYILSRKGEQYAVPPATSSSAATAPGR